MCVAAGVLQAALLGLYAFAQVGDAAGGAVGVTGGALGGPFAAADPGQRRADDAVVGVQQDGGQRAGLVAGVGEAGGGLGAQRREAFGRLQQQRRVP